MRKVTPAGTITTVAGNGTSGYGGDGGAAASAQIYTPVGLAVDGSGNLYIADFNNNRIRMVTPGGTISTFAGNGNAGYSGDGGPATGALELPHRRGGGFRPTSISPTSAITSSAKSSTANRHHRRQWPSRYQGDGGPAFQPGRQPRRVAVDSSGNLYFTDGSATVRKVFTNGFIVTVAGNGTSGYSGDGGPALIAELNGAGCAVDRTATCSSPMPATMPSVNCSTRLRTNISAAVNGASNLTGAISAGDVVVFYGTGLGPAGLLVNSVAQNGTYPTTLGGVTVFFGNTPAPILYVSASQTAVVVPFGVSGATVQASFQFNGQFSPAFPLNIATATPGIFTADLSGQGLAAAINDQNNVFSYNSPSHPANAGDFVEIYVTGAGQTSPPGVDGTPYAGLANCNLSSSVTVGGMTVVPQYCGGVPRPDRRSDATRMCRSPMAWPPAWRPSP